MDAQHPNCRLLQASPQIRRTEPTLMTVDFFQMVPQYRRNEAYYFRFRRVGRWCRSQISERAAF